VKRRPELDIYLLRWDMGALRSLFRGTTILTLARWMLHKRIHTKLDGHHPTGASHHQKIVVIDLEAHALMNEFHASLLQCLHDRLHRCWRHQPGPLLRFKPPDRTDGDAATARQILLLHTQQRTGRLDLFSACHDT
jgi:hypothetical protein